MKHTKLTAIIKSLGLPKSDQEEIKRILGRPEALAVISADEADQLANRQLLVNELKEIPLKIAEAESAVVKNNQAIAERYYKAEIEYKKAEAEYKTMCQQAAWIGATHSRRAMDIQLELYETADHRIVDMLNQLGRVEYAVGGKFQTWIINEGRNFLGELVTKQGSNAAEVDAAFAEIRSARVRLNDMRLSVLTEDEVTQQLKAICNQLSECLKPLELAAPRINKDAEVKEPFAFGVALADIDD